MRDEMDARAWNAHHDQLSEWLDGFATDAAKAVGRLARLRPALNAAAAGLAAFGLTLLSFSGTAA